MIGNWVWFLGYLVCAETAIGQLPNSNSHLNNMSKCTRLGMPVTGNTFWDFFRHWLTVTTPSLFLPLLVLTPWSSGRLYWRTKYPSGPEIISTTKLLRSALTVLQRSPDLENSKHVKTVWRVGRNYLTPQQPHVVVIIVRFLILG
jgi:hypothetical protein